MGHREEKRPVKLLPDYAPQFLFTFTTKQLDRLTVLMRVRVSAF